VLNRQNTALEDVKKQFEDITSKAEFYSFIKNLSDKLDLLEGSFVDKKFASELKEELEGSIKRLSDELKKLEDVEEELGELRNVKTRLASFESELSELKSFSKDIGKLDDEISGLEKQLRSFGSLKDRLKELAEIRKAVENLGTNSISRKDFEKSEEKRSKEYEGMQRELVNFKNAIKDLEKGAVSWKDFQQATKESKSLLRDAAGDIDTLHSEISSLKALSPKLDELRIFADGLDETMISLRKEVSELKSESVSKKQLDKRSKEAEDKVEKLRKELEKTPVIDPGQFVSKAALREELKDVESELKSIKRSSENRAEEKDIKELRSDVDYIRNNMATSSELNQRILNLDEEAAEARKESNQFAREMERMASDFESRLSYIEKRQPSKEQRAPERQKPWRFPLSWIVFALLVVLVVSGIAYMASKQPASGTSNLTNVSVLQNYTAGLNEKNTDCIKNLECRQKPGENNSYWFNCFYDVNINDCRCYVGDYSDCNATAVSTSQGAGSSLNYMLIVLGILVVVIILLFLFLFRGRKKGSSEVFDVEDLLEKPKKRKKGKSKKEEEGFIEDLFEEDTE